MPSETDRIEKKTFLRAPRARVWRALTEPKEFGSWFGMRFDGRFVAGASVRGTIAPTTVDPEVAKMQKPHEGLAFELFVERLEPEHVFAFRWHPHAVERGKSYGDEPTTLVTFELADAEGGTLLRLTESGFDQIPLERRATAFAANDGGWTIQMTLIEKYLAQAS